jgi:hypothetical protein
MRLDAVIAALHQDDFPHVASTNKGAYSLKTIRRITAIILTGSLVLASARPSRSQVQALVAPAVCATGVGCVLLGAVTVGGIVYYIWQNQQTGHRYRASADGTVFRSEGNYNEPGKVEIHFATSPEGYRNMLRRFRNEGRSLTLKIRRVGGPLPFKCIFEGSDAEAGYYDDRRSR